MAWVQCEHTTRLSKLSRINATISNRFGRLLQQLSVAIKTVKLLAELVELVTLATIEQRFERWHLVDHVLQQQDITPSLLVDVAYKFVDGGGCADLLWGWGHGLLLACLCLQPYQRTRILLFEQLTQIGHRFVHCSS